MTLEALGRQYAAEAESLAGLIALCQKRRRAALREGNGREAKRQQRMAERHTQQQEDLQHISVLLRHYYDEPAKYNDDHTGLTTLGGTWVHI